MDSNSPKGLSTPVLVSGRSMSVTASTYITRCLNPVLVPFLEENYPNGDYVFWPDKASSHYARATCSFLDNHGVNYVPKDLNPAEVPLNADQKKISLESLLPMFTEKVGWLKTQKLLREEFGGASKESPQKLYWRLQKLLGRSFFGHTGWGFSKNLPLIVNVICLKLFK